MRSGAITVILAVAALGALAAASPDLAAQEDSQFYFLPPPSSAPPGLAAQEIPQARGDVPTVRDLPPLFVKHPISETITLERRDYTLSLSAADFVVVDDGSTGATVTCQTAGEQATIGDYAREWVLGHGVHDVQCTATDGTGNTSSISYTLTINVVTGLFAPGDYDQRLQSIISLWDAGAINEEQFKKIVVYFQRAGILIFDIGYGDGVGPAPDFQHCGSGDYRLWSGNLADFVRGQMTEAQLKHCLESVAEHGWFHGVSLGF